MDDIETKPSSGVAAPSTGSEMWELAWKTGSLEGGCGRRTREEVEYAVRRALFEGWDSITITRTSANVRVSDGGPQVVRTGRTETMERKWWSVEYIRDADVCEKPWRLSEAEAVRHAAALNEQLGGYESAWAVEVVERRTRVQSTEDSSHIDQAQRDDEAKPSNRNEL